MPRGRPRKNPIPTPAAEVVAKRPRGRPPKHAVDNGSTKAAPSSPVAATAAAPQTSTRNDLRAAIKQARRILRKDDGISTDIERLPLLTWLMFLKFLDENETRAEQVASLTGRPYAPLISAPYRWRDWAAGTRRLSGGDLLSFVNAEVTSLPDGKQGPGLLNYLRGLPPGANEDRRAIIRNVFENRTCHLQDGANLAEVCACIDGIHFTSREEVHTLSLLYEDMLREMRDAAGQNGEFYTPRPVIRLCIEALDPRLGETFIDNACGTGGFVVAAWEHLKTQAHSAKDLAILSSTVRGAEPKPLPYLLVQMNTLLHGMDGVRIDRLNAFVKRLADYGSDDEVDIIGTNVPFGAEVTKAQINAFPPDRQTGDSALLFLQVIMARLRRTPTSAKRPARAAVIVPNGVLSEEGVANHIKRDLLTQFRLHTIIRLPDGVFAPYTDIPTNILLFEVANPVEGQTATEDIWYYQIPVSGDRNKFSKTQPITWDDLAPALSWCQNPVDVEHAWKWPWGERHRAANAAAAPHRQRAQDASEAARACSRELRALKGERPEAKIEITALEQRLAATEAEAKAAQAQADAAYWPAFNLDFKNPRARVTADHLPPKELIERIKTQIEQLGTLVSEVHGLLSGPSDE
jgi:type I restriction enzyme M protein